MAKRAVAASVSVGAIILGSILALPASPAYAACGDIHYMENAQTNANYRGVKDLGMQISNTSITCVRISSVIDWLSWDNYAEVGWYEDPQGVLTNCSSSSGSPLLLAYGVFNGTPFCKTSPPSVPVGTDSFWTQDTDANKTWNYFWNGTNEWHVTLSFTSGRPVTNAERQDLTGSNYANFTHLQKWVTTSSAWVDWTSTEGFTGPRTDDPNYSLCIYSDIHVSSKTSC